MRTSASLAAVTVAALLSVACDDRPEPAPDEAPSRPGQPTTQRALPIGIDRYMEMADLEGAANDVARVRSLLESRFEFPPENVLTLVNKEATREGILRAFQEHLIDRSNPGDIVVFHYSGHGSNMPDRSGEETDGEDETIVPHDSRQGDVFDITDDELNGLARRLGEKTDYVTFIWTPATPAPGFERAAG